MDLQLSGKRALVTGSGIGIGEAIARGLAAEGASVAVHGRNREQCERVANEIIDAGGHAVTVLGDLTIEKDVRWLAAETVRQLGGVDILVNNAGGSGAKHSWEETPAAAWIDAYDRNVVAAVRMINQVLPAMKFGGWGRIVNISSLAGALPPASGPDYGACKAAMNNLTVSLSKAAAGRGVTVNAVSPGTIFTPKLEAAFRRIAASDDLAAVDAAWPVVERTVLPKVMQVPANAVGNVTDIANAVCFLCSPLAGYITGVNLRIDGGAMPAV